MEPQAAEAPKAKSTEKKRKPHRKYVNSFHKRSGIDYPGLLLNKIDKLNGFLKPSSGLYGGE